MIAQLVLPVHKPVKTKVVNYFARHPHPGKMSLEVEVVLPGVTPHQDEYGNFDELWSTLSKSEMPSITLTREQLTREQRILLGLKGYLPQTMIAKLVLPVYEPVKKLNYFSYRFTKKMCLAVKVVLPGVTPPRDENVDFGATSTGYHKNTGKSTSKISQTDVNVFLNLITQSDGYNRMATNQTDSLSDVQLMRLLDELLSSVTNLRDACGQTDLRDASSQTDILSEEDQTIHLPLIRILDRMVRSRKCHRDAGTQTDSILSVIMLGANINGVSSDESFFKQSATSTPFLQIGVLCGDTASTLVKDEAECNRRSAVDNTQELNSLNKVFLGVDSWDDPTSVGVSPFGMGFVDRDQLMNNAIKPTVQHVVKIDDIKTGETHAAFFGANKSNLLLSVAVANFIGANPENLLFSFYREYQVNYTFECLVQTAHGITSLLQTKRYADKREKDQLWWTRFQLVSFLFNKIRHKVDPLKNTNRNFLRIGGPIQFWSLYKNAMELNSVGIDTNNTLVETVTGEME